MRCCAMRCPMSSMPSPADALRLEQADLQPALGQLQRRAQARQPTAHHQHIGALLALQRRQGRRALHRRLVVAALVQQGVGLQQGGCHKVSVA